MVDEKGQLGMGLFKEGLQLVAFRIVVGIDVIFAADRLEVPECGERL